MLDKNGYRCELQDPCSVDLYIGVDVGGGEDINHCFSAPPRPNFSLPFIVSILLCFLMSRKY